MRTRLLGETGLRTTEVGLGSGGYSALGMRHGIRAAARTARAAVDAGVRLIDTAPAYGSEKVVGALIRELRRDELTLSTKVSVRRGDGTPVGPGEVAASLDRSLANLGVEDIDLLLLHGVRPDEYEYSRQALLPMLHELRVAGKVRAVGLSESFARDPSHTVARRALADGGWQVVMLGLNLLNPTADELFGVKPLPVGVIAMHAVRSVLVSRHRLVAHLLDAMGEVDDETAMVIREAIVGLETGEWDGTFPAIGYWHALQRPYVGSVLMGSSSGDHLASNIASLASMGDDVHELVSLLEGCLSGSRLGSGDGVGQHPRRSTADAPRGAV